MMQAIYIILSVLCAILLLLGVIALPIAYAEMAAKDEQPQRPKECEITFPSPSRWEMEMTTRRLLREDRKRRNRRRRFA